MSDSKSQIGESREAVELLQATRQSKSDNQAPMRQTRSKSKSMAVSVADIDPSPSDKDTGEVMEYTMNEYQDNEKVDP